MTTELMAHLQPKRERRYVDATAGAGRHSGTILRAISPSGQVLCLDADHSAVHELNKTLVQFGNRVLCRQGNFADILLHAKEAGFTNVDGIVFDLGFSSTQIETPGRGFSFQNDGPLDMRYDQSQGTTAAEIIAVTPQKQLADILFDYGDERRSRKIARAIVSQRDKRPITSTMELARIVARAHGGRRNRIHPATRTFQALRIYVNEELHCLRSGLFGAMNLLANGGRIVVISFHSLEDRIVKRFFREQSLSGRLITLTPKPLQPSPTEIETNSRSRSAKLRAACLVA